MYSLKKMNTQKRAIFRGQKLTSLKDEVLANTDANALDASANLLTVSFSFSFFSLLSLSLSLLF